MYAILIKDSRTNNYRFFTQKKENSQSVQIPCFNIGRDDISVFSTSSLSELEGKCVELLNSYKATDIVPINVLNYSTDLVWGITEDTEDKDVFEDEEMDFSDFFEDGTENKDNLDDSSDKTNDNSEELKNGD